MIFYYKICHFLIQLISFLNLNTLLLLYTVNNMMEMNDRITENKYIGYYKTKRGSIKTLLWNKTEKKIDEI